MKYFFDTNIISKLVNRDTGVIEKIEDIMNNPESELYINRLVYAESLRAIPKERKKLYSATKETLDLFAKVDVTESVYQRSIRFARYCKSKGLNFGKCELIDYIHFITAKEYELEMVSNDGDMHKMESVYNDFLEVEDDWK